MLRQIPKSKFCTKILAQTLIKIKCFKKYPTTLQGIKRFKE